MVNKGIYKKMADTLNDFEEEVKDIVGTILGVNGYKVIDLGVDIDAGKIVDVAMEHQANIIGLTSMLTTAMGNQKEVVEELSKRNLREKIKVILGGAVVSPKWVEECTADGFAGSAFDAVKLVKSLL